TQVRPEAQTQRTECVIDDLGRVGAKEHQIPIHGAAALENARERSGAQELDDRGLQSITAARALVHLDVRKALGAVARDKAGIVIDLLARERAAAARHA